MSIRYATLYLCTCYLQDGRVLNGSTRDGSQDRFNICSLILSRRFFTMIKTFVDITMTPPPIAGIMCLTSWKRQRSRPVSKSGFSHYTTTGCPSNIRTKYSASHSEPPMTVAQGPGRMSSGGSTDSREVSEVKFYWKCRNSLKVLFPTWRAAG